MKSERSFFTLLCAAGLVLAPGTARASTFLFDFSNLDLAIPDGSAAGVGVTRQISLPPTPIVNVSVALGIRPRDGSPVFNGDLYAGLTHGSGYTVLLNRVGRRTGSAAGYGDNGFNVSFDDAAPSGDVHEYRFELNGSHSLALQPAPTTLTGIWAPDGRSVNPASVLLSDPRTALLDVFNGMDANGGWTLFVADWESGGLAKIDRWALTITVPEPAMAGLVAGLGLIGLALVRRARRRGTA